MKKKQPAITTIEGLATLMQGEFLAIQGRFDDVDRKFTKVHAEFAEVHAEFAEVHAEFAEVHEKIAKLEVTINRIDIRTQNQVDAVYTDIVTLKKQMKETKKEAIDRDEFSKMEKRVMKLEKLVFAKLAR